MEFIVKKLRGYKSQDNKHGIFSEYHCIKPNEVLHKLNECNYTCLYCSIPIKTQYTVRDPEQWTLDRIDNTMGHNTYNVVISCLSCNLKRRNRTVQNFLYTKQMIIKKMDQ